MVKLIFSMQVLEGVKWSISQPYYNGPKPYLPLLVWRPAELLMMSLCLTRQSTFLLLLCCLIGRVYPHYIWISGDLFLTDLREVIWSMAEWVTWPCVLHCFFDCCLLFFRLFFSVAWSNLKHGRARRSTAGWKYSAMPRLALLALGNTCWHFFLQSYVNVFCFFFSSLCFLYFLFLFSIAIIQLVQYSFWISCVFMAACYLLFFSL